MRRNNLKISVLVLLLISLLPTLSAAADISSLIGMLNSDLGVSQQQAEGGTAAIFNTAKQNLSGNQFSQLTSALPGLSDLLGKTTGQGGGSGLGSLAGQAGSLLGGGGSSLSSAAQLADTFNGLGLSPDMVGKFTDIVLGFVNDQGGSKLMQMLQGALM
jgi:hypothetical protein